MPLSTFIRTLIKKKIMKHVLTILMGIVLLLPVSAQTNTSQIRGKVIDISNSDPIYSAYIHLSKSGIKVETVLSDIDGNYYFKELDTGDYEIVATAIILGYDSLKLSGIQLKSGLSPYRRVKFLELSLFLLQRRRY
jgi:hypothetical protein